MTGILGAVLAAHSYGKAGVRLLHASDGADGAGERLTDLTVAARLVGGIEEAYLAGDNARLVTTDGIKSLVYETCAELLPAPGEALALAVAEELARCYAHVPRFEVDLEIRRWTPFVPGPVPAQGDPLETAGRSSTGATTAPGGSERARHAHLDLDGERELVTVSSGPGTRAARVVSGLSGVTFLLSAGNRFEGFLVDGYTTSEPQPERAVAGRLRVRWEHALPDPTAADPDWSGCRQAVRSSLLAAIATEPSESLQHLLTVGASRVLEEVAAVSSLECELESIQLVPACRQGTGGTEGAPSPPAGTRGRSFTVVEEPHGVIAVAVGRPTLESPAGGFL